MSDTYPDDLLYHPEHDWARLEGDRAAALGITSFALSSLGELVHFEPPEVGRTVAAGEAYGEVESVKAVSELVAPLSGTVVEVNEAAVSDPSVVNADPYGEGWLVRIELSDPSESGSLLDVGAYRDLLAAQ